MSVFTTLISFNDIALEYDIYVIKLLTMKYKEVKFKVSCFLRTKITGGGYTVMKEKRLSMKLLK